MSSNDLDSRDAFGMEPADQLAALDPREGDETEVAERGGAEAMGLSMGPREGDKTEKIGKGGLEARMSKRRLGDRTESTPFG